jgi:pyridoxal phosphate enzyme (YggS family)
VPASDIAASLASVVGRIEAAVERSGRPPGCVRLVAVSKTFGVESVRAAAAAGQRAFGENRVQEALQKIAAAADLNLEWHLVGSLQSNKARKAAATFHWIHSVDDEELLARLDRAAETEGTAPQVLVQVDLTHEQKKRGVRADAVRDILDAGGRCRAARVVGLMLLPPVPETPEDSRPHFRALRELRDRLAREGVDPRMLAELSMGMTHDFEVAIEEGATLVRIGTAIFGRRAPRG